MRVTSLLIAGFCLMPLAMLLAAWAFPLEVSARADWHHLLSTVMGGYFITTLLLAAGVACVAVVLGVSSAWYITVCEFPGRRVLSWLLILPFAVPSYLLALSYGTLLEFAGPVQTLLRNFFGWQHGEYWFPPVRSLGGAVLMLGLAGAPYVYMLARLAFRTQPSEWFEVAESLGKSRRELFWRVALPAARPFILIGVTLAVMEAIADIGTVHLLGVSTLSIGIYRTWFILDAPLLAARIASLLLIMAAVLVWCERASRKGARYDSLRPARPRPRRVLKRGKGWLMAGVCAAPVLFGFVIPVAWMVRLSMLSSDVVTLSALASQSVDSLMLAVMAAVLVVAVAWLLACAERLHPRSRHITLAATLGYAMPGVVIAVGILFLQGIVKSSTGTALLFTGTVAGLLAAYLIRFLSPAYSALHTGYQRISPEMDMAAASLGKSRTALLFGVHLPMLRAPMFTAALIVAIDVMKELPATLILRPFDVKTLALAVYEFAGDDRPVEAAPFALVLVTLSTLGVFVLHRLQEKPHG